ncbi:MAG: hypothetical protein QXH03_07415 [Candidatus Bathyarchaeia archaeon]
MLDVTSSMVGCDAPDIMNKVLDRLIFDIDRFERGRIVLITFANGPYDLDGPGPIKSQYTFYIDNEEDKLQIKQFLRPEVYGPFPQDPTWPGIYQKVIADSTRGGKMCAGGIGPTGIYSTILHALDVLELLQKEGGNDYTSTHIQEIVVYTDGRNNAPGSPNFESVVQALKKRNFSMLGRFFYRRYLFSTNPDDIRSSKTESEIIRNLGAEHFATNLDVTEISNLVTIYFDRRILTSDENLWDYSSVDTKTVAVRNIHVFTFPWVDANLLAGWRVVVNPISSKDFGLPDDIGLIVKTQPSELVFPLSTFDLLITITSYRKCREFIEKNGLGGITGNISFTLVPPANIIGRSLTVDLRHRVVLVNVTYNRPKLWVQSEVCDDNSVELNIKVDQVFLQLPEPLRTLFVSITPGDFLATAIGEKNESIDVQRGIKIERPNHKIKLLLRPPRIMENHASVNLIVKASVSPELSSVDLNEKIQSEATFSFALGVISLFPTRVTTANIWSPQKWCGVDTAPMEVPVEILVRSPFSGTLRFRAYPVEGLPADIKLKETSVKVMHGESRVRLNLLINPLQSWYIFYKLASNFNEHVFINTSFNADVPSTIVFSQTIVITFACNPSYTAVYLTSLTKNPKLGEPVYSVTIKAEGVPFPAVYLIFEDPVAWKIRDKLKETYFDAAIETYLTSGEYDLLLFKAVPDKDYNGAIKIAGSQNIPLLINVDNVEYRLLSESFTLLYQLHIKPVEVKISCTCAQPYGRWRRGQSIMACSPSVTGIYESQNREITFFMENANDLLVKTHSTVHVSNTPFPFEPFEIIIGEDAPAGRKVSLQINHMRVLADISTFGLRIEAKVEKPFTNGYLVPKSYEKLVRPALYGIIYFIWGSAILVGLILAIYAVIYEKLNPFEFFINYIWYNQKMKKYTLVWLMFGICFSFLGLVLDILLGVIV